MAPERTGYYNWLPHKIKKKKENSKIQNVLIFPTPINCVSKKYTYMQKQLLTKMNILRNISEKLPQDKKTVVIINIYKYMCGH